MKVIWEQFECQRCGRCCDEFHWESAERISEIAQFLNLTDEQFLKRYYGRIVVDEDVRIWEEDHGEIAEIFGEEAYSLQKKEVGREYWEPEDHKIKPCPFLSSEADGKTTCIIYEVRPLGCRIYPFESNGGRCGDDCPGARIVYERLEREGE
ncbi:MAG: YkgJ family cysteine cluster protein [Thermodesulfobacteriota bacterium]